MLALKARSRARPARLVAWLLAGACLLAPLRAFATEGEDFQVAREAYTRGEYERAVQLFEPMVGGEAPAIRDDVLIRESRKYLAAAYVLTGQRDLGARQFEFLLRGEGDRLDGYRLDRAAFPHEVLEVFDFVRRELLRQRESQLTAEQRREEEEARRRREAMLRLVDLAQHDEIVVQHDPLIAWIPFGAGQFQNGSTDLGAFFLATESITLLGAVATLSTWLPLNAIREQYGPELSPVDASTLRGLQIGNWVSAGAFAALAVVGILEAHINFVPSHTVRRDREVPADALEGLDISVGPASIGLRFRF